MVQDESEWCYCIGWIRNLLERGSIAQWLAYMLLDPAGLGLNPSVPKKLYEENIFDVAEVN